MSSGNVIIIGGGHNGLVCAFYLARAGCKVTVLERRDLLGGAAVTEYFAPDFRNSTASYTVSLLNPVVIRDMSLYDHGLQIVPRKVNNYLPLANDDSLVSYPDLGAMTAEVARHSSADAAALPRYYESLSAVVPVVREVMLMTPPVLDPFAFRDLVPLFRLSQLYRQLDQPTRRFLIRLFTCSAIEVLDEFFESDVTKTYFAFDATVGHFASPESPGSAYVLLHHVVGEVHGKEGAWGHAVGGMGSITQAMAKAAKSVGVVMRTGAEVTDINIHNQQVSSVVLQSGETLSADVFVANVNPKLLHQSLLPQGALSDATRTHFDHYHCSSGTLRMNVALSRLPEFTARNTPDCLQGGVIMAPDTNYMHRAYEDARTSGFSMHPIVEMLIPSIIDDSLAPAGQHVASLFCQHFDPDLREKWKSIRFDAAASVIDTVERFAPGFRDSIVATQIHSPWDLEQKFGLVGGDIFHGRLSIDQLFSARPMLGHGDYSTEFSNLHLCGSGAHPGGGVSGIPGHNAAREILRKG